MILMSVDKKKIAIVDTEPTWVNLCNGVQSGAINAETLLPACKIADIVRQAQKQMCEYCSSGTSHLVYIEGKRNFALKVCHEHIVNAIRNLEYTHGSELITVERVE